MAGLRFCADVDGVLYNWHDMSRFLLFEKFGIEVPPAAQWDSLKDAAGREAWEWLWNPDGGLIRLFSEGHSYPGALEGVREVAKHADIIVISSVPERAVYSRVYWLARRSIPCKELHITMERKSLIRPHCDVYLDDGPHNIKDLAGNTDAVVLVWDQPWNANVSEVDGRVVRVKSWNEVIGFIVGYGRVGE